MSARFVSSLRALPSFCLVAVGVFAAICSPAAAADFGKSVSLKGTLASVHGDDFKSGKARDTHWALTRGSAHYRLKIKGAVTLPSGSDVSVSGVQRGRTIEVASLRKARKLAAKGGRQLRAYGPGGRKVVVFLIQFEGGVAAPTPAEMRPRVFLNSNSPNAFFKEESGGQTFLTGKYRADGDVFGPYTVPATTTCDTYAWGQAGRQGATAEGYDMSGYDHYVTIWPRHSACAWAGQATTNSNYADINTTGFQLESALAHELGHSLGIHHATSYSCTGAGSVRVTLSPTCTVSEYGDPFDNMGSGPNGWGHHSAGRKSKFGWYGASGHVTASAGDFTLAPMEQPGAGAVQSLRIPRPAGSAGGNFYYLEFRQPYGAFDTFAPTDPVVNGVTVRLSSDYNTSMKTYLLDMTPKTASYYDAPLARGASFYAEDINTTIYVDGISPAGASVRLVPGAYVPPDIVGPTVTISSPANNSRLKGNKVTVKATATDDAGVARMELYIDGALKTTVTGATLSYTWATGSVAAGPHTVEVRATDTKGNVGSVTHTVTK